MDDPANRLHKFFEDFVQKIKRGLEDSGVLKIARRYFVMNSFDGSLTMLGIIVGSYISGVTNPHTIIGAGVGACLAMGISGLVGAYATERAERVRELKEIENAMLTDLHDSEVAKTSRLASLFSALVDGLSPSMSAIPSLIPFYLSAVFLFPIEYAFIGSVLISLCVLFALGAFLGKIAQENLILHGLVLMGVGLVTALILMLVKFI